MKGILDQSSEQMLETIFETAHKLETNSIVCKMKMHPCNLSQIATALYKTLEGANVNRIWIEEAIILERDNLIPINEIHCLDSAGELLKVYEIR